MDKKIANIFFGFLLIFGAGILRGEDFPKPSGWISDNAGVIDSESAQKISSIISELEAKTGAEIAVVMVKSLKNDTIENFSIRLFQKWGIGKKGKDNGVLIISAIEDRKVRIEVGYGLEGILPDGLCGQILDTYVIPHFKKGEYAEGLSMGVLAVASVIAKDAGVELTGGNIPVRKKSGGSLFVFILQFMFAVIMIYIFIRHPLLFFFLISRSGGGRGFGSGSSGGFGGFGGGLGGGGGASRSW
ncbi:MAG TPA: methanol dehydrogenase [Elusimicrobia bacterium]|nr:methanol dehydrogenase [Elusimicrobiota bacterium]